MSNTGHLAPTDQLAWLGETPVAFFDRHVFTYSHDYSIGAVADGMMDGAAVDSLVYDQMAADDPGLASRTRIIARWGPYGIPPVVTSPDLDSELKQRLLDFFLNMQQSDEGRGLLEQLGIDRFVLVRDELYDTVREMRTELEW
jgi:phosphonate transport system substrate-binding protein